MYFLGYGEEGLEVNTKFGRFRIKLITSSIPAYFEEVTEKSFYWKTSKLLFLEI